MFYHFKLERKISLDPHNYGTDVMEFVRKQLLTEVENKFVARYGYVVAVTEITDVSPGVMNAEGLAQFTVKYKAIILRVFVGEPIDVIVTKITNLAITATVGPITINIPRKNIPSKYEFSAEPLCYKAKNLPSITLDTNLRIRISNTRENPNGILVMGSLNGNRLGPIEDPQPPKTENLPSTSKDADSD